MGPRLLRFFRNFSFRVNYDVLRYVAVCGFALAGAVIAAFASGGDVTWIIIAGAGCYVAGRVAVRIIFRE